MTWLPAWIALHLPPPDRQGDGAHGCPKAQIRRARSRYTNNIFSLAKWVGCTRKGAGKVQFLTGHFTILGIQAQNWMLIAAAVIAIFAVFALATRDRG
jgi:hypothetical protein